MVTMMAAVVVMRLAFDDPSMLGLAVMGHCDDDFGYQEVLFMELMDDVVVQQQCDLLDVIC